MLKNYKPIIVGRGYKRESNKDVDMMVSDGNSILCGVDDAGDEMYLIAQRTSAPVFSGKSISNLVDKILRNGFSGFEVSEYNLIIVDDGFQHRRLYRDVDIVLVDSATLTASLVPWRMREPLNSLNRADIIILSELLDIDIFRESYLVEDKIVFQPERRLCLPDFMCGEVTSSITEQIVTVTGLAKPNSFFTMLTKQGYNVVYHFIYPDHHNYSRNEVIRLCMKCNHKG